MAPTFMTIAPELRLAIYEQLINLLLPESDEFFHRPARSLIVRGTSPYVDYDPTEVAPNPWTMLRVCKLVRAELRPLLDSVEQSRHLVYEFQGFSLADMQAWAVAAGSERVAAMQRWTMSAVMLCPEKTHMRKRSWKEVQLGEDYGLDPIRWAPGFSEEDANEEKKKEEANGKGGNGASKFCSADLEMFHANSAHVDFTRLGMSQEGATVFWNQRRRTNVSVPGVFYTCFWWEDWNEHERCEDYVNQDVSNVVYDLVKGPLPPRMTVDSLCQMLHELSYGIRDMPSIREDWARCLHTLRHFDRV